MHQHADNIQREYQVAIIGAGFGGIIAARAFKPVVGDGLVIFEKAGKAGGVWRDNIYPGCACDVPANLYSIKSVPNPDWSARFAPQPEILAYIDDVINRSDLVKHIRYQTDIKAVRFVKERGGWLLTDAAGHKCFAKMVIMATGSLNKPNLPFADQYNSFKGKILHSAQWDNSLDYKNKRIAVIGTGASAIQIIPEIAASAAELHVFQRSPAWVIPRRQSRNTVFKRLIYHYIPPLQWFSRERTYWFYELIGLALTGNVFFNRLLGIHASRLLNRQVKDPRLRRELTPDYKLGCKRIVVSDNFYRVFNRANVHLITDSVMGITSNGIITRKDKVTEVDVIILATGFNLIGAINSVEVTGLHQHTLREDYADNIEAYLGINVAGYPNFTFIMGPNSGPGHISVIHIIESQVSYILKYWDALIKKGLNGSLDVKPETQKRYNEDLAARFGKTVWASGCRSWYLNEDGKNFTLYPELAYRYRQRTNKFNMDDYIYRGCNLPELSEVYDFDKYGHSL